MKSQVIIVPSVSSKPAFCMTKSEVTRMNAAQPFMLIVVQIGSTKRATRGFALRRVSAEASVTGSVPAELFVKSATASAGAIFLNTWMGLRPRASRNSGSTTKNWMTLPPSTTAVYLPSAPTMTPASICAESCAEKARMPSGSAQSSARISVKSTSCAPSMLLRSTARFSVFGMNASARPTAAAMSMTESTLPERNGCSRLFGMTVRK